MMPLTEAGSKAPSLGGAGRGGKAWADGVRVWVKGAVAAGRDGVAAGVAVGKAGAVGEASTVGLGASEGMGEAVGAGPGTHPAARKAAARTLVNSQAGDRRVRI